MDPFPDVTNCTIFPGMESNTLEFKQSLSNIIKNKITATICSFLNAKGGHIVFGVEDRDRRIIGLKENSKELDDELRWFDNFYHNRRIVDSNGNSLSPGTIEARVINVTPEICIMVVTVRPRPNETYKCQDGIAWYRLAASVYSFNEGSAEKRVNTLTEELNYEQHRRKNIQKELLETREDLKMVIGLAKKIDDQLEKITTAVETDILLRKRLTEQELQMRRESWCSFITNIIYL